MAGTGARTAALAERYGPAGANLAIAWNDTLASSPIARCAPTGPIPRPPAPWRP